jgi:hypothetical protein
MKKHMMKAVAVLRMAVFVAIPALAFIACSGNSPSDPPSVPVSKTALAGAISAAETLLGTVATNEATDPATVDIGEKYATAAAKNAYQTAITTANGVNTNSAATQSQVDGAVSALATATTTFYGAIKTGTKPPLPALAGSVSITGTAQVGHTLTAVPALTDVTTGIVYKWTRNGEPASLSSVDTYTLIGADADHTITVTVSHPDYSGTQTATTATVAAETVVNALDLSTLVTAPVKGEAQNTTFTDNDQYTGTIAWKLNDGTTDAPTTFAAGAVYKAILTLTAKTGYTFTGVAANSFRHTGATTVANAVDTGVVTITFPATLVEVGITIGLDKGLVIVTGPEGNPIVVDPAEPAFILSKTGGDKPAFITLTATGFASGEWRLDGDTTSSPLGTGNTITLNAATNSALDARSHSITFRGVQDEQPYAIQIPFAVVK